MTGFIALFVVIALGLAAAWQIRKNPQMTRGAVFRSLGLLLGYFLFGGVGLAIVFWVADGPQPQDRAVALTAFLGA